VRITDTRIADVKLLSPDVYRDERGVFFETWNASRFAAAGIDAHFVQHNHSRSRKGVLRGLHYQIVHPQGKLLQVVAGAIFDVVVDLRRSSPSFGEWVGFEISARDCQLVWVPPGFAHGFLALEDGTAVAYKCTDFYAPQYERTLLWNDPSLGIPWPLDGMPALSEKDRAGRPLSSAEVFR
jgi:dTDP-4-dehydrorhamnose 3,5-epimerase